MNTPRRFNSNYSPDRAQQPILDVAWAESMPQASYVHALYQGLASPSPYPLQYMYNLKSFGHRTFSRRAASELQAAEAMVASRVKSGELGALSPLE